MLLAGLLSLLASVIINVSAAALLSYGDTLGWHLVTLASGRC